MQYIIYFDETPLIISSHAEPVTATPNAQVISSFDLKNVDLVLKELRNNKYPAVIIKAEAPELVFAAFKAKMYTIIAGGGLVYTADEKVMLIFRKGKWDLPKGKQDPHETLENTAVREVEEETGAKNLIVKGPLFVSYHTYREKGVLVLKESNWYWMQAKETMSLKPQKEEDIEKCEWTSIWDVEKYFSNIHPAIREVLLLAQKSIKTKV